MNVPDRIKSFDYLGDRLRRYHENTVDPDLIPLVRAAGMAADENPWFTPYHIQIALNKIGEVLHEDNLHRWLLKYNTKLAESVFQKTIGVVMAGNIPAVGFHDFLCVLISGNKLNGRLSSGDARLLPAMADILTKYLTDWQNNISFTTGRLTHCDAIIATGSDNTSRYFEFYFSKYPHIIRKNRNSIAILDNSESKDLLNKLADDIMLYFGMGCRSISKLFVPKGYDFSLLISAFRRYNHYIDHHKYRNNYDYCKSIFLVGQTPYIDAGCLLLKEDKAIPSRIAVLHFEYYDLLDDVVQTIRENLSSIQCVVSNQILPFPVVLPGEAQNPSLWTYADDVDTLDFLLSLNLP